MLDYEDSVKYLNEIKKIEEKSKKEYESIGGSYENERNGLYIAFKEDNKMYIAQNKSVAKKNTTLLGWSYAYLAEEQCFKVVSDSGKIFWTTLKNGELQIVKENVKTNANNEFEKALEGTYQKIQ